MKGQLYLKPSLIHLDGVPAVGKSAIFYFFVLYLELIIETDIIRNLVFCQKHISIIILRANIALNLKSSIITTSWLPVFAINLVWIPVVEIGQF